MAGVYSKQLLLVTGTGPFVYTVPAGKRTIIRSITCYNGSQGVGLASVMIAGNNGLFIVANAGQQISIQSTVAGFGACVSGQELDAT